MQDAGNVTGHLACKYKPYLFAGNLMALLPTKDLLEAAATYSKDQLSDIDKVDCTRRIPRKSKINAPSTTMIVLEAGPMQDWDTLYGVMALCTMAILSAITAVTFGVPWFVYVRRNPTKEKEARFYLFDSPQCESLQNDGDIYMQPVCFGPDRGLGDLMLVLQILVPFTLLMGMVSLFLQCINFAFSPRSDIIHKSSIYTMLTTCLTLLVTGHILHNRSVWRPVEVQPHGYLRTESLTSGVLLLCAALAMTVCVVGHVSSRSPGFLCTQPSFLRRFLRQSFSAPQPQNWEADMNAAEKGEAKFVGENGNEEKKEWEERRPGLGSTSL